MERLGESSDSTSPSQRLVRETGIAGKGLQRRCCIKVHQRREKVSICQPPPCALENRRKPTLITSYFKRVSLPHLDSASTSDNHIVTRKGGGLITDYFLHRNGEENGRKYDHTTIIKPRHLKENNESSLRKNTDAIRRNVEKETTSNNKENTPSPSSRIRIDNAASAIPPSIKNGKRCLQQLYLDFGQRDFAKRIHCRRCGMMYVHGVEEDLKEHLKVCKDYLHGVRMGNKPWKKERVVQLYSKRRDNNHHPAQFISTEANDRIIEVRGTDPLIHRKKVVEVKQIVDNEMGFVQPTSGTNSSNQSTTCSHNNIVTPESSALKITDTEDSETDALLRTLDNKRCYLYISASTNTIIGLCIAEEVDGKRIAARRKTGTANESKANVASFQRSLSYVGIYQLWTHSSHRSIGIASRLVDSVRATFFYGTRIPRHLIAFSSPTTDGIKFAEKYTQFGSDKKQNTPETTSFLMYDVKLGNEPMALCS